MPAKIGKQLTKFTSAETGGTTIPANDGFICDVASAIPLQLRADTVSNTLSLLGGVHYDYDVKTLELDAATPTVVVYVVKASDQ